MVKVAPEYSVSLRDPSLGSLPVYYFCKALTDAVSEADELDVVGIFRMARRMLSGHTCTVMEDNYKTMVKQHMGEESFLDNSFYIKKIATA